MAYGDSSSLWLDPDWPHWRYDLAALALPLGNAHRLQGRLLGRLARVSPVLRLQAERESWIADAHGTSTLDDEPIPVARLREALDRRLGFLSDATRPDPDADGALALVVEASEAVAPVTLAQLLAWHKALYASGFQGLSPVHAGALRAPAAPAAQLTLGLAFASADPAPAAAHLDLEVAALLVGLEPDARLDPLLQAGIVLLWGLILQPFEAGSGRLARALADRVLARAADGEPRYHSPWAQLARERAAYEEQLRRARAGSLDVTAWLAAFLGLLQRSMHAAEGRLDALLAQAEVRQRWTALALSARQIALLEHLADAHEAPLTCSAWASVAQCSADTALRDITGLMEQGLVRRRAGGGRSTAYELAPA